MQKFLTSFVVLIALLLTTQLYPQDINPSGKKIDLGFDPSEFHRQEAQYKMAALERQIEREKQLTTETVTNWQEYDITYYDAYWYPDHASEWIYGEVGIYGYPTTAPLDSVIVNLSTSLTVDSVYNSAGNLIFDHADHHLTVSLDRIYASGEQFGFTVVYHGPPDDEDDPGMYFFEHNGTPFITTSTEPYYSRSWWPCNDIPLDKADSVDIRIRADNGLVVSSIGLIVSDIDNGDGTHTIHWRHRYPIVTYLVALAITEFDIWEDYYIYSPTDSMPIVNYVLPDFYDSSLAILGDTPNMLAVFADMFGEYPFLIEKYGHAHWGTGGGGMEHQTNTFLGAGCGEYVVVHEAAHQWWGDMITCRSWAHIWLNEGFASYCEALYYETVYGRDYYHAYMEAMEFFGSPPDGSIVIADTSAEWHFFSPNSYDKGAWVLHMLRRIIGDEHLFNIFKQYYNTFAYQSVATEDFQDICESVTGMDLDFFFQQWLYGDCYPIYTHSYYTEESPGGGWDTYVHLRQTHETEPLLFIMPLEIRINMYTGDSVDFPVYNDQDEQDFFVFHTDSEPRNIEIDPQNWVLNQSGWEPYGMRILNDDLSDGTQGEPYLDSIIAKGGYPGNEQICSIIDGELPQGLNLEPESGIISGTTYATGDITFTIEAADEQFPASYADTTAYTIYFAPITPRPGDANVDSGVDVGDAVFLINYIFSGGPAPEVPNWADANADCDINVGDAVYLIMYIFNSGPEPQMGCVE
jgi:hypothetical protein